VQSFPPNGYGLYNMLGNVWEWVSGGEDAQHRILRGGSFLDSRDGAYNHIVLVSTRQINPGDSGASNIGFRCAGSFQKETAPSSSSSGSKHQEREEAGAEF
jgi:sulfatase modifying factor 1